jgi:hypothetical protein
MELVIALAVSIAAICLFLGWIELVSANEKLDRVLRLLESRRLEGDEWKDI